MGMVDASAAATDSAGYWFPDRDRAVDMLAALRRFRVADAGMRRRLGEDMELNPTDLEALRRVIAAERRGEPTTPRALADALSITTASMTKLIDRLVASGHVERSPHPRDRRSRILTATPSAHDQVRESLGDMHERMLAAARDVPAASQEAVIDFLTSIAAELTREAAGPTTITGRNDG